MTEANLSFRVNTADIGASLGRFSPPVRGHPEDTAEWPTSQADQESGWCLKKRVAANRASAAKCLSHHQNPARKCGAGTLARAQYPNNCKIPEVAKAQQG
jgi:hypothetical protein